LPINSSERTFYIGTKQKETATDRPESKSNAVIK